MFTGCHYSGDLSLHEKFTNPLRLPYCIKINMRYNDAVLSNPERKHDENRN
nr:MAG TPA: hypothetical protein [Caudoviricetes sp.]